MALNLKSHEITKGEGGSSLSQVSPYLRLSNGSLALFVQGGAVYSEDGKRVREADLPDWFEDELEKLTPEAKEAVGLNPKPTAEADEVQPKTEAPKPRSVSKPVPMRKK